MVYLNDGLNGTLFDVEKWHTVKKLKKTSDIEDTEDLPQDTIIWGPTLHDNDVLGSKKLVSCLEEDWLVFYPMGAYSLSLMTNFGSMEKPFVRSVVSNELWFALGEDGADCVIGCIAEQLFAMATNKARFQNGAITAHLTSGYVLEQHTPDHVARAMIESGQQKQAFYIFNMDEVYRRVQHFKEMMPRVKMFYAVKANDTNIMLRLAVALGLGFDCASPGEIYKIRKLNVDPRSIIYAMPCKTPEEMDYAQKAGVKHTTFDSSCELKKMQKFWPDARLLIRIRIESTAKKNLGLKYGCDFHTEATDLLDEAASLGLKVAGVAFHVGSVCFSPESYVVGLQQARALFDYEAKAGRRMTIVDIGGGFLSDKTDRIDEVAQLINDKLEELFADQNVQVVAEPGRYLSDSAFKMFCSVNGIRQVNRNNKLINMIYINNGVYGTMKFDENWHKLSKFQWTTEVEPVINEDIILWGPTCDNLDRVMRDYKVRLPRCVAGDWLVVENHGAYTFTFSTKFSSMEIPLIRPVISKKLWNNIKESSVFEPTDFVPDSDISASLPSTLPALLPMSKIYEHTEIPTLKI